MENICVYGAYMIVSIFEYCTYIMLCDQSHCLIQSKMLADHNSIVQLILPIKATVGFPRALM